MHKGKGLVSIIIPVYNTGPIIKETIQSVLDQTYSRFELIAIDDGSQDDAINYLDEYNDPRIRVIRQYNQGMAQTRNNGLRIAIGEFVLFLDHDDVLASDFLSERVNHLTHNSDIGFVGGPVCTFPDDPKEFLSAANDVERELLFLSPIHVSTPSAYVIRRGILTGYNITFNTSLSSTADQFLLLQLNKVTKGICLDKGTLFYRVSAGGFSQTVTLALMKDNENFLAEMEKYSLMPRKGLERFKCIYYFMLAGGYRKCGIYRKTATFLIRSFFSSPKDFFRRVSGKY